MNSFLVGTLIIGLGVSIIYYLLKKSPKRWWAYTSIVAIPLTVIMMFVFPIWISPIFNDFSSMKDKELETKILTLAESCGIEGSRVFEVNTSIDTKTMNAYVTGFSNTKRIVLTDTLIKKLDEDELLFVMAHEISHYMLGHLITRIIFNSLIMVVALYLVYKIGNIFIHKFKNKIGFYEMSDIASLPLLFLLIHLFFSVLTPINLAFSRYQEHEADRFALEITQNNYAGASAFVKLQEENLQIPRPGWFYKTFRSSHPILGDRIDFCNTYRPWEKDEPLVYEKYFTHQQN